MRTGDLVRIGVYDPNRPDRDDVELELSLLNPTRSTLIQFVNGSKVVRGFFRAKYVHASPPVA